MTDELKNSRTNCYFLSDFHLGIPDEASSLARERLIIKFFDEIKDDAAKIFLVGDIFDFWFEYSKVVPKGFVRILAKIAELTDAGIEVHLFKGNHDLWEKSYLKSEIGVIYHRKPEIIECNGKKIHIAHGDGLGPDDFFYKLLLRIFEGRFNRLLFKWIHPDIGVRFGLLLSNKHRYTKRYLTGKDKNIIAENELLYKYASDIARKNPDIDYLIYGDLRNMKMQCCFV